MFENDLQKDLYTRLINDKEVLELVKQAKLINEELIKSQNANLSIKTKISNIIESFENYLE